MKILNFDNNIYKQLRNIFDKQNEECDDIGISLSNDIVTEIFVRRFFVNHWNTMYKYFGILEDISKQSINNLMTSLDVWNGGIIILNADNLPDQHLEIIINFLIKEEKDVYLIGKFENEQPNKYVHFLENIDGI